MGLSLSVSLVLLPAAAVSRPERIREGVSYYSDDFVRSGEVHDIAEEKNYEEVYQLYTYYEAIYDAGARVTVFKEYERGKEIREERYRYGKAGVLIEHSIAVPGKPVQVIPVRESEGPSKPAK
jgi:hypothetical protein